MGHADDARHLLQRARARAQDYWTGGHWEAFLRSIPFVVGADDMLLEPPHIRHAVMRAHGALHAFVIAAATMPDPHTPAYVDLVGATVRDTRRGLSRMQALLEGPRPPYRQHVSSVYWHQGADTPKGHALSRAVLQMTQTGHLDNVNSAFYEQENISLKAAASQTPRHKTPAAMKGLFQAIVVNFWRDLASSSRAECVERADEECASDDEDGASEHDRDASDRAGNSKLCHLFLAKTGQSGLRSATKLAKELVNAPSQAAFEDAHPRGLEYSARVRLPRPRADLTGMDLAPGMSVRYAGGTPREGEVVEHTGRVLFAVRRYAERREVQFDIMLQPYDNLGPARDMTYTSSGAHPATVEYDVLQLRDQVVAVPAARVLYRAHVVPHFGRQDAYIEDVGTWNHEWRAHIENRRSRSRRTS